MQDPNAQFCTKCGAQLQGFASSGVQSEVIGAQIKSATIFGFGTGKRFDLYFTDKRLGVIDLGRGQAVGAAAGGMLGRALAKRSENKEREKRGDLSLDQMIAQDPQDNFAVGYDEIQSLKLSPPSFVVKGSVEYKAVQRGTKFGITKEDYNALKTFLPNVSSLSGKLEIK